MIRILDLLLVLVLVIVLIVPSLFISFLTIIFIGRNFIFTQTRLGKEEEPFEIYKFKTMKDLYDDSGELLPDEVRLTKFGIFLRSTSLDEIPGIINVILGNMSFVGPRPLLPEYLPFYKEHEKRRHDVLPGITGLAQINGRNTLSWEDKFRFDVHYVDNRSFMLNVKILFSTLKVVLRRDGITPEDLPIMPKLSKERQSKID